MKILLCFYHLSDLLKLRCVSITLAMFWNNVVWFYHFSDGWNKCDVFLSLWANVGTNAMCFDHFSDGWNNCDVFLLLWRWFETMRCVSITIANVGTNATCFYHFCDLWRIVQTLCCKSCVHAIKNYLLTKWNYFYVFLSDH